jgi:lipopolysaccharide biosynthesis glycosyltransferase
VNSLNRPTGTPIVIATATDAEYLPLALVLLESIASSASGDRPIEFHVLYDGTDHWALRKLERFRSPTIEVSVHRLANPFQSVGEINAFPPSSFFRHAIPEVLAEHKRALYLDLDIIVQVDLAPLFDADLKGNAIGGVPCTSTVIGALLCPPFGALPGDPLNYRWRWYFREILGLNRDEDFINYVQSGVMLIDLEKHRRQRIDRQVLQTAIEMKGRLYHAQQGVMNKLLIGQMTLLDPRWNRPAESLFPEKEAMAPPLVRDLVRRQRLERGILHFGGKKPWFFHHLPGAGEWWATALRSPARYYALGLWAAHAWRAPLVRDRHSRMISEALQRLKVRFPGPYSAMRSIFRAIKPRPPDRR